MRTNPRPRAALLWLLIPGLLIPGLAAPALADDEPTLTEIVNILREKGLLDEDEHTDLAARAAKEQDKRAWTDRVSIWGDFRGRYEGFFFERDVYSRALDAADPSGDSRLHDRHRVRYRARLDVEGEVASRAIVHFRIASGEDGDPRSLNQTLGRGLDFDNDEFRLDLAYATLSPYPDQELPGIEGGLLAVDLGKVRNPFVWDELAEDSLLWDGDITLEGSNLRVRGGSGPVALYSHSGVYVIDENTSAKDPAFFASQLGGTVDITKTIRAGTRGSYYHFFSLDDDFFARAATGGNFADGLARRNLPVQVLETSAFLAFDGWELLPIQLFGSYAHNLSARSSQAFPGVEQENDAYVVGVSVGDKKLLVRIGFSYYYIEANAFPSMFIDSDILDSTTNREGFAWVLERQLIQNVDLVYTAYLSDRIEGGVPFAASGPGSDRFRTRVDLKFKF